MRLTLDAVDALSPRLPALTLDHIRSAGGQKKPRERQRGLLHLVQGAYSRRNPHEALPDCEALGAEYLEAVLHARGSRPRIDALLAPLFEFPEGRRGWDHRRGLSKPYRLRAEPRAALEEVHASADAFPVVVEDANARALRDFRDLPDHGIDPALGTGISVPKVFPVELPAVDRAVALLDGRIAEEGASAPLDPVNKPGGLTLDDGRSILLSCRGSVKSIGGLPNLYALEDSGRLGGVGRESVVGLPRPVRQLLLAGSGLVDYDIRACNWSLFANAADALGFDAPHVRALLEDPARYYAGLAAAVGLPSPGSLKPVLLSLLTGATLSPYPHRSGTQAIGEDAMRRLAALTGVVALHDEVRTGMGYLTDALLPGERDGTATVFVNAVDGVLRPDGRGRVTAGQKASHLLTGLEQLAVRSVCPHVRGLRGVIYDGFIAEAQDTGAWAAHVREASRRRLGFPLEVSFKATPFDLPVR